VNVRPVLLLQCKDAHRGDWIASPATRVVADGTNVRGVGRRSARADATGAALARRHPTRRSRPRRRAMVQAGWLTRPS